MATIQDIHALETRIYDIVDDYIKQCYLEDDVLVVSSDRCEIKLEADSMEKVEVPQGAEVYPLKELVRPDENGNPEPDNDKISDIANSWLFLD